MSKSSRSSPIAMANQIVTNALIHTFVEELTLFYEIVDYGEQFIFVKDNQIRAVFDASSNKEPSRLLEMFCSLFTNTSNILVNAEVLEQRATPTLKLTLQDGTHFTVYDFTTSFMKL